MRTIFAIVLILFLLLCPTTAYMAQQGAIVERQGTNLFFSRMAAPLSVVGDEQFRFGSRVLSSLCTALGDRRSPEFCYEGRNTLDYSASGVFRYSGQHVVTVDSSFLPLPRPVRLAAELASGAASSSPRFGFRYDRLLGDWGYGLFTLNHEGARATFHAGFDLSRFSRGLSIDMHGTMSFSDFGGSNDGLAEIIAFMPEREVPWTDLLVNPYVAVEYEGIGDKPALVFGLTIPLDFK